MKKIVSAVAIAALVLGAASAADVTVKLAGRMRADAVKSDKKTDSNDASKSFTTTTIADLNGNGTLADDLQIGVKTEYADATVKLLLNGSSSAIAGGNSVSIDTTYYGALHFGALNLTGGRFDSRWSARYNAKTTEIGLTDSTAGKYGVKNSKAAWATDVNNVSAYNAGRGLAFVTDYTFKDVGGGDLLLKASVLNPVKDAGKVTLIDSKTDDDTHSFTNTAGEDDSKTDTVAAFGFSVGYKLPDTVAVEGVARIHTATRYAFALIAQPLMIPGKTLAGFTFAMNNGTTDKGNALAFDLGTVQTFADKKAQLIAQVKYDMWMPDGGDNVSGLYGYLGIGYKLNDIVKVALDGALEMVDLTDADSKDGASNSFTIQPAVQFTAGSGATIQTGFKFKKVLDDDVKNKSIQTIEVPVVLRVSL